MRGKGSCMEQANRVGVKGSCMEQANRVGVHAKRGVKDNGDTVVSVQKPWLPWAIITIAVLLSFCSSIVFAQTERMESKVAGDVKAILKVTPSQNMVDLILSDAKTGKAILSAKVFAKIKGADGKIQEKELLGMKMGDVFSYMNTLDMSKKGSYIFDIMVELEKKKVKFNFAHEVK